MMRVYVDSSMFMDVHENTTFCLMDIHESGLYYMYYCIIHVQGTFVIDQQGQYMFCNP